MISGKTEIDAPGREVHAARELQPIALRSMFWRPAWLQASAWQEHVPFAFWLVDAHRPRTVVELGAGRGTSYFSICQAVDRLGLNTRCFAVDEWKDDPGSDRDEASAYDAVQRHNDAQYSGFSRLVRSTFDDARQHFADGSIDLLLIDGGSTLEAVSHDFESWLPKLSERGIVALHNTNVREPGAGVHRFFDGLRQRYPTFEFVHGRGLGVIGVGGDQGQMMRRLFDAAGSDDAQWSIREVFSRLGRSCADAYLAQQQQADLKKLTDDLAGQRHQLDEVSQELVQARELLEARASDLAAVRERHQQQDDRHSRERGYLVERVKLLQEVKLEMKEQVARLQGEVDAARQRLQAESAAASRIQVLEEEHVSASARHRSELEQALASSVAEAGQHERDRAALQARLASVQADNDRLERENRSLCERLESAGPPAAPDAGTPAGGDGQAADAGAGGSQAELLEKYRRDIDALADARRRAEASLQARFAETAQLTRQLIEHQQKLAKVDADAREKADAAERELDHARGQLDRVRASLAEARATADHFHQRYEHSMERIAEVEATAEALRERLRAMESSRSWRLTGALRRLRGGAPAGSSPVVDSGAQGEAEPIDERSLVQASGLFAESWYLARYPDVAGSGIDPIDHYLLHGAAERRDPSPSFSTAGYLALYPDVAEAGENPLVHFLVHGLAEGRDAPESELPR